jgi:rubrerythrin
MKPTKKWLKEQIKDEKMASKMYVKYGFPQIAKDERKHRRILERKLKKVGL